MREGVQASPFRATITATLVIGVLIGFWMTEFFKVTIQDASLRMNADIAACLLSILGEDAQATGTSIHSSRFSVDIGTGCDALLPYFLFAGVVIAFPVARIRRVLGVVGGGIALLTLNQIRIVTLYYTGLLYPVYFDVMHRDVWQVLFIAVSVAIWTGWAFWAQRLTSEPIRA